MPLLRDTSKRRAVVEVEGLAVGGLRLTAADLGVVALSRAMLELAASAGRCWPARCSWRCAGTPSGAPRSRRSPASPGCRSSRCRSGPRACRVKSTPSCGHCAGVVASRPRSVARPGMAGRFAVDRQPTAVIRKRARQRLAALGRHRPAFGRRHRRRARDAGAELDVAAQVEPVGHVAHVAHDLGLAGIALGPLPAVYSSLEKV